MNASAENLDGAEFYDPFMDQIQGGDPYPIYQRLRDEAAIHFKPQYNAWFFSRFEDIWNLSKRSELSVAEGITPGQLLLGFPPNADMISQMDPPRHSNVRKAVNPPFSPVSVAELETEIRSIARKAITDFIDEGKCDLIRDYTCRIACEAACLVSGLPREDTPQFIDWINAFFHRHKDKKGDTEVGAEAGIALNAHISNFLQQMKGREKEASGALSILFNQQINDHYMGEEELLAMLSNLQIGASDTVPKGMAASFYHLWKHTDQRLEVAAHPDLAEAAFVEAVRLDMPTQMQGRVALKDFTYGEIQIKKDQRLVFLFASANRDSAEFENPNAYNIHRNPKRTLIFGNGIHRCLGSHLANLEGRIAVQELLAVIPNYEIDLAHSDSHYTEYVKGWAHLQVSF